MLHLDDTVTEPDTTLHGTATVPCRVRLWWSAEGHDPDTDEKLIVSEQRLTAPGPFHITVPPDAALSHKGTEVRLFWVLTTRGDGPDAVEHHDLQIVSASEGPAAPGLADAFATWSGRESRADLLALAALSAIATVGVAIGMVAAGLGPLAALAVFPGVGGAVLWWRRARPRTAGAHGPVCTGDTVDVSSVLPGAARWRLLYREEGVVLKRRHYQSGGSYRTRRWRHRVTVTSEGATGEAVVVLMNGPSTLLGRSRRIRWAIELTKGDIVVEVPLLVAPRVRV
ncbi:MAG: hypothetical protein ACI8S6_002623 [Myxococcota bacterium]|jgi:hypothetical protein